MMLFRFPLDLQIEIHWQDGCLEIHICRRHPRPHLATHIETRILSQENTMELQVGVNKASIMNVPKDDAGIPRQVDGPIVCNATPDGIVHLEPSPDGALCDVIPVAPGTAIFTTRADADLSPADRQITGNPITITVTAAPVPEASHIDSIEGPVVPQ